MPESDTVSLRVMTFNVRVDADEGRDAWERRRPKVASVLRVHRPDVVGLQEPRHHQLSYLDEALPAYEFVGVGRRDGETEGEYAAVGYRPDRFELLEEGTFWLSETPDRVGSVGWDADVQRIVTWARLRDREVGGRFVAFNTHFDHEAPQARLESAHLLRARLDEVAGSEPATVVGDFNATEDSKPYDLLVDPAVGERTLLDARYEAEHGHHGPTDTFHRFTGYPLSKIDYVFVTDDVAVREHAVLPDHWNGRYPSDHLPVVADVDLPVDGASL